MFDGLSDYDIRLNFSISENKHYKQNQNETQWGMNFQD